MTVTYTADVATSSRGLGCFWKLLLRWKGSIYKLVWHELIIYCSLYALVSLVYRLALSEAQKRTFERVAVHVEKYSNLIPMAFVLGFYVSLVIDRWWEQYNAIPWPNTIAVFVSFNIRGQSETARVLRRTLMRYINLSLALTLSMVSPTVKKRFPTMDHLVKSGLLTEQEQMIFEIVNLKTKAPKYWLPLVWAGAVVAKARKQGSIKDDLALNTIMSEITNFRRSCHTLFHYDSICIPLVYTQVVTLAVYAFFFSTVIGRQFLDPSQGIKGRTADFYIPWFTILQFFFYMGWLKVAESLINPFGEDDDDFDVDAMVEKNLKVSYLIVDEMHEDHPEPIKDMYYDEVVPAALPYTVASEQFISQPNQGSTAGVKVPEAQQAIVPPPVQVVDDSQVVTVVGGVRRRMSCDQVNQTATPKRKKEEEEEAIMYKLASDRDEDEDNDLKKRSFFGRIAWAMAAPRRGTSCSGRRWCSWRWGTRRSSHESASAELMQYSVSPKPGKRTDSGRTLASAISMAGSSADSHKRSLPQVE